MGLAFVIALANSRCSGKSEHLSLVFPDLRGNWNATISIAWEQKVESTLLKVIVEMSGGFLFARETMKQQCCSAIPGRV